MSRRKRTPDAAKIEGTLTRLLAEERGVAVAYLFGSVAADAATPMSDIDVALLFESDRIPVTADLFALRDRLADEIGMDVDVVCLNTASPILAHQVLRHGKKILVRNPRADHAFFVRTINQYDDLKRIRRPIEQQILRGRIYG